MDAKKTTNRNTNRSICFISLSSYPLLARKNMGFAGGGAEVVLVQLAKEIAKQGFEVSFITYGDGRESIEFLDKIKVIKVYQHQDVLRLNILQKTWYIWNALRNAGADIYLESPGLPGIVSLFCRLYRRKSILSIASDLAVTKQPISNNSKFYLAFANLVNLKLSNMVVVLSNLQKKMLWDNFGRSSIIIKNPIPLSNPDLSEKNRPPTVLWVAELRSSKGAEHYLDLAKAIPEVKFQMIGGPMLGEESYFDSIRGAANKIQNIEFLGLMHHEAVLSHLQKASILVNTSLFEGFPITFLEAWATYTPVVSLNSNPDEVISRYGLGFHSKNFHQMVKDVKTLLNNKTLREEMGKNGRKYVEQEHDIQNIANQYVILFRQLVGKT